MRLICPNCDAQYEVPDEVVPAAGRDVQCSNCGKTWFQHHPDHLPEEIEEITLTAEAPTPDEETAPPPVPDATPAPKRKELDPAVADILRQEAETEFEARKQRQQDPLESQPELGLDTAQAQTAPPPPPKDNTALEAKKRMARMRGEPEPSAEAAAAAAAISSRRELLPDIEEINSTLRNDNAANAVDADTREQLGAGGTRKTKKGFKRGFVTVLVVMLLLILVYGYAAQISAAVPALAGVLDSYVAWVDQMRVGLDAQIKTLLSWLDMVATRSAS